MNRTLIVNSKNALPSPKLPKSPVCRSFIFYFLSPWSIFVNICIQCEVLVIVHFFASGCPTASALLVQRLSFIRLWTSKISWSYLCRSVAKVSILLICGSVSPPLLHFLASCGHIVNLSISRNIFKIVSALLGPVSFNPEAVLFLQNYHVCSLSCNQEKTRFWP